MNSDRPHVSIRVWLALFPVTFAIHFVEEFWCGEGYTAYLLRIRGVELSSERFVAFQIMGFVLFVAAGVISRCLKFPEFMIAVLGGLVLANGLSHSITAFWFGGYGPGLYSSLFLWIPLGALSIIFMFRRISHKRLATAVLIGFATNGIIALVTIRGGRLL